MADCNQEQAVGGDGKSEGRGLCGLIMGQERCRCELWRSRQQRGVAGRLLFDRLVGKRQPLEEVSPSPESWSRNISY